MYSVQEIFHFSSVFWESFRQIVVNFSEILLKFLKEFWVAIFVGNFQ